MLGQWRSRHTSSLVQEETGDRRLFLGAGAWNLLLGVAVVVAWDLHPALLTPLLPLLTAVPYKAALGLACSGVAFMALGLGWVRVMFLWSVPGVLLALASFVRFEWPGIQGPGSWFVTGWGDLSDPQQLVPITSLMLLLATGAPPLVLLAGRRRAPLAAGAAVLAALALAALLGQFSHVWPVWQGLAHVPVLIVLGILAEAAALLHYGWQAMGRERYGPPLLVGLAGVTVSVVLSHAVALHQRMELVRDTQAAARSAANEVSFQTSGLSEVRRIAHFWSVAGMPTPRRARLMAEVILQDFPGIRAINWLDPSSRVRWHIPPPPSKPMVGRMLRAVPGRGPAFDQALRGAEPAMTRVVPLVNGGRGIVVFVPVGQRRIVGFLAVVFIPSRWFDTLLVPAVAPGFHLDVALGHDRLFSRGPPGEPGFRAERRVSLLGQTLVVGAAPEPATASLIVTGVPVLLLAAGASLSLLAAIALYAMQTARRHEDELTRLNANLEQVVVERTAVLEERTAHLEEERERWRVTLLSIGEGVIVTDARGRVTLMNPQSEVLTGWSLEEARGRPVDEVFDLRQERSGGPVEGPVRAVLGGAPARIPRDDRVLRARDGHERPVAESAAAIRSHDAKLLGAVLVFRDISGRRALEEEALKARGLESLGVLAGGIAHDFNNILTGVIGNLTLARHYGSGDPALNGVLDEAERSAWRARELTMQLLTFAKGGAPVKKVGSVADTVRDVCPFFLKGSRVRCDMAFDPELWPVDFDSGQLSQVVHNLVVNAVEAMPAGGILKVRGRNVMLARHEVSGLEPGPFVELSFADSGTGIERQHLSRIFDPYFSLKPKGTGLGLAISYSIMKRHQGAILVHSEPGCGATFRLYLPKADVQEPGQRPDEARPGLPEGGGARVLLMEDDALVRGTTAALLRTLGYAVTEAREGREAVSAYEAALAGDTPFDAVVLDLTVPGGMGGLDCLRALKQLNPRVRAVVASGYYNDPVMAQATEYGFTAAVAKPFHLEELAHALRVAAGRTRAA